MVHTLANNYFNVAHVNTVQKLFPDFPIEARLRCKIPLEQNQNCGQCGLLPTDYLYPNHVYPHIHRKNCSFRLVQPNTEDLFKRQKKLKHKSHSHKSHSHKSHSDKSDSH
jgi:hypothetical protein